MIKTKKNLNSRKNKKFKNKYEPVLEENRQYKQDGSFIKTSYNLENSRYQADIPDLLQDKMKYPFHVNKGYENLSTSTMISKCLLSNPVVSLRMLNIEEILKKKEKLKEVELR